MLRGLSIIPKLGEVKGLGFFEKDVHWKIDSDMILNFGRVCCLCVLLYVRIDSSVQHASISV